MTPLLVLLLCVVMVGTAFLSGLFGMAGGLVLVGVLLLLLPLPAAMALHAVNQIASNLWRAVLWRRHVRLRAAWPFLAGSVLALGVWSVVLFVPDRAMALLLLGLSPFAVRLLPARLAPDPHRLPDGLGFGAASMSLMLLTGVSGPLVDTLFLSSRLDRREIVATKAVCQVVGHALKLLYFGGLIEGAALVDPAMAFAAIVCSVLGTTLARRLLDAMTEATFRAWANRLVTAIALVYVAQGAALMMAGG